MQEVKIPTIKSLKDAIKEIDNNGGGLSDITVNGESVVTEDTANIPNMVTTNTDQQISGVKRFEAEVGNLSNHGNSFITYYDDVTTSQYWWANKIGTFVDGRTASSTVEQLADSYSIRVANFIADKEATYYAKPTSFEGAGKDLGAASASWKDLYMSGKIKTGANAAVELTLPEQSGTLARVEDLDGASLNRLPFTVPTNLWTASVTYPEYPFEAAVPVAGITSSSDAIIIFDAASVIAANNAQVLSGGMTLTDAVKIFAVEAPSAALTGVCLVV